MNIYQNAETMKYIKLVDRHVNALARIYTQYADMDAFPDASALEI